MNTTTAATLHSTSTDAIALARKHASNGAAMVSSARSALADAEDLGAAGEFGDARLAALRSLSYSVGRFHPDFRAVEAMLVQVRR